MSTPASRTTVRILLLTLAIATLSVMGCGDEDDDDTMLHFANQDVSEANYRAYLRASKVSNPMAWSVTCTQVKDLSPEAALNFFRARNPTDEIPSVQGGVVRPGQKSDEGSMRQAASIVKEECA